MIHVHKRLHTHHGWWRPECSCGWQFRGWLPDKRAALVVWREHRDRATERAA